MASSTLSKLMQIPLIVILGLLLAYGGVKAYVYLQVADEIESVNSKVRSVSEIRYRGISSALGGRISVDGIQIVPRGPGQIAAIDRLELTGDGPMFLLKGISELGEGKPPDSLQLTVSGLRLPLNGQYAARYSGLMHTLGQEADACAFATGLSAEALRSAGLDELAVDMTLSYERREGGRVHARASLHVRGIEGIAIRAELSNVPQPGVMMAGVMPRLDELAVRYEIDPSFSAGRLERCAEQRGQTAEEYIDELFGGDDKELARTLGIVPGPGLRAALKRFLEDPKEIDVRIRPPATINLAALAFYKPQDALTVLNPRVTVNGEPVKDLSFRLAPGASGAAEQGNLLARIPGLRQSPVDPEAVPARKTSPRPARAAPRPP
ncbi:MAG: hypothetical protein PVF91_05820, partial [Chromatiales bacterium]